MAMSEKEKRMLEIFDENAKKIEDLISSGKAYDVPDEVKLCPGKLAHYYALLIYHEMKDSDALKEVETKSYDEINKKTHVDFFITAASEGIEKYLFKYGMRMTDLKEVVRGDGDFVEYGSGYLETVGKYIKDSFDNGPMAMIEQCMNVAEYMNNKRIQENIPDDFSDNPTEEHKILRELPLQLAGLKEAENYYTFMLPLIDKFKLPMIGFVGTSKSFEKEGCYEGHFISLPDTEMNYSFTVLDFLEDNNIRCKEDLRDYLKNIGKRFDPLKPENAPEGKKELAEKRLEYLTDDKVVDKLTDYLLKINPYIGQVFYEFKELQ